MTRISLPVALLVGALLAPQAAQAQHDPGGRQPLRTFCMSSAMDYCMSILTWEYEFLLRATTDDDPPVFIYNVDASSLIHVFGPGWAANPRTLELWANGSGVGGSLTSVDLVFRVGTGIISGPGTFEWGSEEGPFGALEPQTSPADVFENPLFMRLGGFPDTQPLETCALRDGLGDFPRCHEIPVPEPGTLMLILTGVLGLGLVGLRRRREVA